LTSAANGCAGAYLSLLSSALIPIRFIFQLVVDLDSAADGIELFVAGLRSIEFLALQLQLYPREGEWGMDFE
jgi:hypothetical protein